MLDIGTKVTLKKDTRVWEAMQRRLLRGAPKEAQVGFWGGTHPSGNNIAQIAAWNEEGHMNGGSFAGTITPARPFIRQGFMSGVKKYVSTRNMDFHRIAMGQYTWSQFHDSVGYDLQKLMRTVIQGWDKPPNSPVTVYIKGFNNPLIETGTLMASVKYKIVQKRSTR